MLKKFPAVAALTAVVIGIALSDAVSFPAWLWLVPAMACVFLALWFRAKQHGAIMALLVLAGLLFFSGFSYSSAIKTFPPGHVIHYADGQSKYKIFATVDDWPVIKIKYTDIFATVDSLEAGSAIIHSHGRLLIHVGSASNFVQYGDRVILQGRLYPIRGGQNPNGFDYRRHLNLRSVFAVMYLPHQHGLQVDPAGEGSFYSGIEYLRRQILEVFSDNLGNAEAALASGFLIGETRQIDNHIYELFRNTGTLHLLAVSGSNVGLVILIFVLLLRASPLKRIGRTILLLIVIFIFSFLSYNQPSVVRAALMAALILLGRCFQRRVDYNNIIATAALIILLVEPVQLFDVGFQLSFVTAWGLIFIMPRVAVLFGSVHRNRVYRYIAFPLLVCLAAQVVSLPLSAYYFNRLPLISFLSNLVIVPLVSMAIIGEVVLVFAVLALPVLGTLVGSFLNPLLSLIIKLLGYFDSVSWTLPRNFMPSTTALPVYFGLVILAILAISSRRARRFFVLASLISGIGLTVTGLFDTAPTDDITVLSVSTGYVAISQRPPAMVILADLSLKDYSYTEKVIKPLLDNWGMTDFDVVVISGDYATAREGIMLSRLSDVGRLYIPEICNGLARDIARDLSMPLDSSTIFLLGQKPRKISDHAPSLFLGAGLVVYSANSSRVILADDNFVPSDYVADVGNETDICYFVLPKLDSRGLQILEKPGWAGDFVIIANSLDPSIREYQFRKDLIASYADKLRILSQAGAISIVTRNGRLRLK